MNIEITSRHFKASEKLKGLVYEKMTKIKKFSIGIINCHVILTKEGGSENVEIVARANGHDFIGSDIGTHFEESLINAVNKISIQIIKHHRKSIGR